jgi:hypothetical protein
MHKWTDIKTILKFTLKLFLRQEIKNQNLKFLCIYVRNYHRKYGMELSKFFLIHQLMHKWIGFDL